MTTILSSFYHFEKSSYSYIILLPSNAWLHRVIRKLSTHGSSSLGLLVFLQDLKLRSMWKMWNFGSARAHPLTKWIIILNRKLNVIFNNLIVLKLADRNQLTILNFTSWLRLQVLVRSSFDKFLMFYLYPESWVGEDQVGRMPIYARPTDLSNHKTLTTLHGLNTL